MKCDWSLTFVQLCIGRMDLVVGGDISFSGLWEVQGTDLFFCIQEFCAKQTGLPWHVVDSHTPSTSSVGVN
jgi:hypothetical protein